MPTTEMIVSVALVAALALGFVSILRLIGTVILHRTIRRAVDRDPDQAQELITTLGQPKERTGDDRLATILFAIGLAIAAGSVIAVDDPGLIRVGIAASLFPLIMGGALWLRLVLIERARRRGAGQ